MCFFGFPMRFCYNVIMKKLLIVTVSLLLFANCSYAQFTVPNLPFRKTNASATVEDYKNDNIKKSVKFGFKKIIS